MVVNKYIALLLIHFIGMTIVTMVGFSGHPFNPYNLVLIIPLFLIPAIIMYVFFIRDKNYSRLSLNIEREIGKFQKIKSWEGISDSLLADKGQLLVLSSDQILFNLVIYKGKVIEKCKIASYSRQL